MSLIKQLWFLTDIYWCVYKFQISLVCQLRLKEVCTSGREVTHQDIVLSKRYLY